MIPAILGAGITTINVFVGTILASLLPGGSVTYLFYADRIMELPLGVLPLLLEQHPCLAFQVMLPLAIWMS